MSKIDIPPAPTEIKEFNYIWQRWLSALGVRIGSGPQLIPSFTVANAPSADEWYQSGEYSSWIFVSDEAGGATMAFTDGTNWRRVQDRAIIS